MNRDFNTRVDQNTPLESLAAELALEDVVTEVLVDQNDRVEPGQLLVRLDRQPFELTVAQNEAALAIA
jgi:multidrug efflux pump subunit AcrA (membrane-fusion protein)